MSRTVKVNSTTLANTKLNILKAIHGNSNVSLDESLDPAVLKAVGKNIDDLLKNNHLTCSEEGIIWDETYKCWEYYAKISGQSQSQTSLEEKTIKVKLLNNKESDLKQTGQDYINRCNNLTESAVNLINNLFTIKQTEISIPADKIDHHEFAEQLKEFNSTIKNKIAEIEQHKLLLIETLGKLDPAKKEDHDLAIQAFQELNSTLADHLLNLETTILKLTNKTVDNKLNDLKYFKNKQPSFFQKLTEKQDDKLSHKTP